MIDIKELRIGNWVMAPLGEYMQVQQLGHHEKSDYIFAKCKTGYGANGFEPIPLTAEILEKAGFEQDGGEFMHPNNTDFDLMFCCSENGLWCAYNFGYGNGATPFQEHSSPAYIANPICNPFKYVHQLQNLYFAITGQELEIEL